MTETVDDILCVCLFVYHIKRQTADTLKAQIEGKGNINPPLSERNVENL